MITSQALDSSGKPAAITMSWDCLCTRRFAVVLGLIIVAMFPQILLGTQSLVFRDFGLFGYPVAHYHRECFWRGELPLWNPLNNCGIPFLAQWNTLTLYPLSLIYLLLPMPWSLNLFCLIHLYLAGMGMFCLTSRWAGCRLGAAVAGTAFMLSGLLMMSLMWPNVIAAFGWMPWVILTAEQGWKSGGSKVWIAALVGAIQMLAGMPELILFTWVLAVGLLLVDKPGRRSLSRFAGIVVLITGLTAVQLLPSFELVIRSPRNRLFDANVWPMPGWGWVNFFVPLFRAYRSPQGVYLQPDQGMYSSYYIALPVLVMAVCAVLWIRRGRIWLLAAVTCIAVWLAMGDAAGLYRWLTYVCPPLKFMRYPVKFVLVTVFTIPVLAAFGVARWRVQSLRSPNVRTVAAVFGAVIATVCAVLGYAYQEEFLRNDWPTVFQNGLWRLVFLMLAAATLLILKRQQISERFQLFAMGALLLLIAVDSLTHTPSQNPSVAPSAYASGVLTTRLSPAPQPDRGRAMSGRATRDLMFSSMLADTFSDYIGRRSTMLANCNLLDNVASPDGFYSLHVVEQMLLWENVFFAPPHRFPEGLADFLGITHQTNPSDPLRWLARTNAMPFVSVGQKPLFADPSITLEGLMAPRFDPRQTVYLPVEAKSSISVNDRSVGKVVSQRFRSHKIELEVEAAQPALVVLSQTQYVPWSAFVDRRPEKIWRANYAFQAVQIPAGRHKVELIYKDRLFEVGAAISLLTLCCWACGLYRSRKYAPAPAAGTPA